MAFTLAFALSKESYDHVKSKSNMSAYVEKLIREDMKTSKETANSHALTSIAEYGYQKPFNDLKKLAKSRGEILTPEKYLELLDNKEALDEYSKRLVKKAGAQ